tara:strand:+ start:915 stop:1094 length:180 start_codon:yes stop_codon:yes gene_type:complete
MLKQDWLVLYHPPDQLTPSLFEAKDCTSHGAIEMFLKLIPAKERGPQRYWCAHPAVDYD